MSHLLSDKTTVIFMRSREKHQLVKTLNPNILKFPVAFVFGY